MAPSVPCFQLLSTFLLQRQKKQMNKLSCGHLLVVLVVCLFCFVFRDRASLCIFGYPKTHSGDEAGLELIEIRQPLPPKCWDSRHVLAYQATPEGVF